LRSQVVTASRLDMERRRSQIVTLDCGEAECLRSQFVMSNVGGSRQQPHVGVYGIIRHRLLRYKMPNSQSLIPAERIERSILLIRGQKILLDNDLASLYGVATGRLLEAVKRNAERFPEDFMFQLDAEELDALRSQIAISKSRGGRRYAPYAFTEQGVAMLSSVLRSPRAVAVNIEIMRAFVRLRQMLFSHADLSKKVELFEKKYDSQFKVVFDALRQLMQPPEAKPKRPIGFHAKP
jgi:hypothetical protein